MTAQDIVARLVDAGAVLRRMPALDNIPNGMPSPDDIGRADEVLFDWMARIDSVEKRLAVAYVMVGLSWGKAARKDRFGRSPDDLRHDFDTAVNRLVHRLNGQMVTPTGKEGGSDGLQSH